MIGSAESHVSENRETWGTHKTFMTILMFSGVEGVVETERSGTARKREQMGVVAGIGSQNPRPVSAKNADTRTGHPRELR
jgi:hypothetical protein